MVPFSGNNMILGMLAVLVPSQNAEASGSKIMRGPQYDSCVPMDRGDWRSRMSDTYWC